MKKMYPDSALDRSETNPAPDKNDGTFVICNYFIIKRLTK